MIDNFRNNVVFSGLVDLYRKFKRAEYMFQKSCVLGEKLDSTYESDLKLDEYYKTKFPLEWDTARKIYNAHKRKVQRIRKKILFMLEKGPCLFCTFTFEDKYLDCLTDKTRRTYITRFLGRFDTYYIANIDYGSTTEREHYHAIIQIDYVKNGSWSYGYDYYERIIYNKKSAHKISRYINKLTNHSVKKSAGNVIYSKNFANLKYNNAIVRVDNRGVKHVTPISLQEIDIDVSDIF